MFNIKTEAEIMDVHPIKEASGEDWLPAIKIKIRMTDVEAASIGLSDLPKLAQGYVIKAQNKIYNVIADIDGTVLRDADLTRMEIEPLTSQLCRITLVIHAHCTYRDTHALHQSLKETVTVSLAERQLSIASG